MRRWMVLFVYISTTYSSPESYCDKKFSYHQSYGYGYDISCEKLDAETLQELSNAIVYNEIQLTIRNSNLKSVRWRISHTLPKLREIRILNSTFESSNIFEKLENLKILNIENSIVDNSSYNGINTLSRLNKLMLINNTLTNFNLQETLYSLDTINLNNNRLDSIENYSPCKFPNLVHLYLQNNFIAKITNTTCLQSIEKLYLDYNNIDYINLTLPSLEILSLSYNRLESFKSPKLPLLTELNLEGNNIKVIQENSFQNMRNLIKLNMKNNKITVVSSDFFANNLKLNSLNLNGNGIHKFSVDTKIVLATLDLSNNQLRSIDFLRNINLTNSLDLSLNVIDEIQRKVFYTLTHLNYLNLSYNDIGDNIYPESFRGLESLTELDLSNTKIQMLSNNSFVTIRNLKILNISNNQIEHFLGFDGLHSLTVLNISHNKLKSLSANALKGMKYLNSIDLDGNQLKHIDYRNILEELPNLQMINIRNNSLTCEYLDEMIRYFKNNTVSFTLDNKFDFDQENVEGVYCKEHENEFLKENTAVVNHLHAIDVKTSLSINAVLLIISLSVMLIIIVIVIWSVHIRCRRRYYLTDEVELLDARRCRSIISLS